MVRVNGYIKSALARASLKGDRKCAGLKKRQKPAVLKRKIEVYPGLPVAQMGCHVQHVPRALARTNGAMGERSAVWLADMMRQDKL